MYQPAKYSRKNMQPTVYIMSNTNRGTLYIGVTSNLIQRIWQHKTGVTEGFTQRYGTKKLVYYEQHESMESAILREKQLKKWRRQWKINLIHEQNPAWNDLWDFICGVS
jgi:putative endonuclease